MDKNLQQAVLFYAVSFIARILSFDGNTVIEQRLYENQFTSSFDQGAIMTPEEAEGHGINLFEIIDPGAGRGGMTLGGELRDWRAFGWADPAQMRDMGNGFLWLGDSGRTVWKNPRIEAYIAEKRLTIPVFEASSACSAPATGVLTASLNVVPATKTENSRIQVQREMTPPDGSIIENWELCTLTVVEGRREKRLSNFIPVPLYREYKIEANGETSISYIFKIAIFTSLH